MGKKIEPFNANLLELQSIIRPCQYISHFIACMFCFPNGDPWGIWPFVYYAYICTWITRNLKETVPWSIITWPVLGNKTYKRKRSIGIKENFLVEYIGFLASWVYREAPPWGPTPFIQHFWQKRYLFHIHSFPAHPEKWHDFFTFLSP